MKKYYAKDGCEELWHYTDMADAVEDAIDSYEITDGDTIEIYSGDLLVHKPGIYTPEIERLSVDSAIDIHGDIAENWLNTEHNLQQDFEQWFDKWCIKNNQIPGFGEIINVKPIKVLVTDFENCKYEVIDDN